MSKITPVILSGGAGTRLWPLSNSEKPKQFLALTGDTTMFQMTLQRCANRDKFTRPMIVGNAAHQHIVAAQLAELGINDAVMLLEPCARNTAPAIALSALACDDPETPLLVMPSDHVIGDVAAFHQAISAAMPSVQNGWLTTFGITPTAPETGYGYIQMGDEIGDGLNQVARFIEKPPLAAAQDMIAAGGHFWNGGIFLFRAKDYLAALEKFAPKMLDATNAAMAAAKQDSKIIMPDADCFAACPSDSIDYAVMENAASAAEGKVAVVPVSMEWSDVGSWDALHEIAPANQAITEIDGAGNFVRSDGIRIHLANVEDMIVVAAGNDIIITPRGQSQNIKKIVDSLK